MRLPCDYHDIKTHYGQDAVVSDILEKELKGLIALKPDSIIICCNTLHKYYDLIKNQLNCPVPIMHAIDLVSAHLKDKGKKRILLLATQFTMEDGFFAKKLEHSGIEVTIPDLANRLRMQSIHAQLAQGIVTQESKDFFSHLISCYTHLDGVVIGASEYDLVLDQGCEMDMISPMKLQVRAAVDDALRKD
jgi:aspartate racemase